MVFSTLLFVFFFFVLSFIAQAVFPRTKQKNIVLLVSSLIFYAWGGPLLVLLLAGMTFICWYGALLIERQTDAKKKKYILTATLVVVLGLLAFFKYTGFLLENINLLFGASLKIPDIALPIGISFYTFQLLSYVVDVYRGTVEAQKKYWLLLLYASLFHQCIAGPIVRYSDVNEEILQRSASTEEVSRGITRFSVGLCKKAFLANGVALIADSLLPCTVTETLTTAEALKASIEASSAMTVFLGGLCYMLQIYLDFSAYSDMAIGMGLMIGFHYKENFNYPYSAVSVTDFWRRWHISLSGFFRDYVYIPLGGNRCSVPRHIFNMFAVWFLTGMWHGASWNYILWGLYFFVFLIIEKYMLRINPKEKKSFLRALPGRIATLAIVFISWILFRFEDMSLLLAALRSLFMLNGNAFADTVSALAFKNNVFLILLAVLACFPVIPAITCYTERKDTPELVKGLARTISAAAPVMLLLLSLVMLVGDSYNPFLYFQF